jgi:citrate synthase
MYDRVNVDWSINMTQDMLFAIGRSVGWIGHAMEQYATGQLIRPRARYVGVPPAEVISASVMPSARTCRTA